MKYRVTLINNSLQGFETHDFETLEAAQRCAKEFDKLVMCVTKVEKNQFGFTTETLIEWK